MNSKLEQSISVWMQIKEIPAHTALTMDVDADRSTSLNDASADLKTVSP